MASGYPYAMDPPAGRPEQPADAPTREPDWPLWFPLVALFAGLAAALLIGGVVYGIVHSADPKVKVGSTGLNIANTVLLDLLVVAGCFVVASIAGRPRAWQFGLRRAPLGAAIGAVAIGLLVFIGFEATYSSLVQTKDQQQIAKDLGSNLSTAALIASAVAVVGIAPIAEEIFFRGFLFRALRLRMPLWPAALIDGIIFGAVHQSLVIFPVLAVLGVIFCVVYERTGSLFPTIAMHSLNNVLAFGSTARHGWGPALAVGGLVIAGCLIVPRLLPPSPRPVPAE